MSGFTRLSQMRGCVSFNNINGRWFAHAPDGTLNEAGNPGLLTAYADSPERAVDDVYQLWTEAGYPPWPLTRDEAAP